MAPDGLECPTRSLCCFGECIGEQVDGARCRSGCGGDERVEVPRVAVDDLLHDQRSTTGERVASGLGEREQQACKVALDG